LIAGPLIVGQRSVIGQRRVVGRRRVIDLGFVTRARPHHQLELLPFGLLRQLILLAGIAMFAAGPPALAPPVRLVRRHQAAVGADGVTLSQQVARFVARRPQPPALEPFHLRAGLLDLHALQRRKQLVDFGGAKSRGLAIHQNRPVRKSGWHGSPD
jgi:hypothetical protein